MEDPMIFRKISIFFILAAAVLVIASGAYARKEAERLITTADLTALAWRPIGPANMGGRVSALALVPCSRTDSYVGFATGGLFKSNNLGTTLQGVFRHESTSSIGALGVANAPEDWVGWENLAAAGDTVPVAEWEKEGTGRGPPQKQ